MLVAGPTQGRVERTASGMSFDLTQKKTAAQGRGPERRALCSLGPPARRREPFLAVKKIPFRTRRVSDALSRLNNKTLWPARTQRAARAPPTEPGPAIKMPGCK